MEKYFSQRFPALRSRDFRIFVGAQFISNVGSQMQFVALNWQIYEITHSAFALGLLGLLRFLPILIFSLIAGSVADAHNRKNILYLTSGLLSIFSVILAYTTFSNTITPAIIFAVTALSTVVLSFNLPARQAFIPNLIDKKYLPNAMSLNSILFQTSMILGPTISGLLIAKAGLSIIYISNALSFLAVIVGLEFMSTSGEVIGEKVNISLESIVEGLNFVRSKTIIWSMMLLDFFGTFFSSAAALLPIFAKDILKVGPQGLGLLYSAGSIGAVIGGIYLAHNHNLRRQGLILLLSIGLYGAATIIFGISRFFALSFFALLLVGMGDGVSTIIRNTIRQLETPDYIRGRMASVNMIFYVGGPQLGDFEAGALASLLGAPLSVVIGGVGTIIVVGWMTLKLSTLRNYDRHQSLNT